MKRSVFAAIAVLGVWGANAGMPQVRLTDPLEWLYPDSEVAAMAPFEETDVPANGVAEVNLLFNGLEAGRPLEFSADCPQAEWFQLVDVPVGINTGSNGGVERPCETNRFVTRNAPYRVYDAMKPLAGSSLTPGASTVALRFRLRDFGGKTGVVPVRLSFAQGGFKDIRTLRVNVHSALLPPVGRESFRYTNWMNYDTMAVCHGLKLWSPQHLEMIRRYVRLAVYGRQNMAIVPYLGSVERTEAFVSLLSDEGIWYLEGRHLASFSTHKWGAPAFVPAGSTNLTTSLKGAAELARWASWVADIVRKNGWTDRWYQHVADEPSSHNIVEYRQTCGIVRKYMPGVRLFDAVETFDIAGALDAYCPKNKYYEENRESFEALRTRSGDEIWCYTCMFPGGRWLNRLLDNELIRPVLLPWGCAAFSLDGYLHWGYNQFTPKDDPMRATFSYDEHMAARLPPGDRNIVYAGDDGPWPSVRLEAMRQGFEDLELLRLLAKRDKPAAEALTKRLFRGFSDYETDTKKYWAVRRELLK